MKNSNTVLDFRRYELVTVILLIILIMVGLLGCILSGASDQEIKAMRNSAINIKKTVMINHADFQDTKKIYLSELIDDKLISEIKSPVSKGNCSSSESYVELVDGRYQVTLRCGNYMIGEASFVGNDDVAFYKVSDWSEKKKKNSNDKNIFYNCLVEGKEKYNDYYEKEYFLYSINKDYQENYSSIKEIKKSTCKVVSKTFYRKKIFMNNNR